MENKYEAPINFYGAHFEPQKRTDLPNADIPHQINFLEEIQIRVPKRE